jgi:hypothetical protein
MNEKNIEIDEATIVVFIKIRYCDLSYKKSSFLLTNWLIILFRKGP